MSVEDRAGSHAFGSRVSIMIKNPNPSEYGNTQGIFMFGPVALYHVQSQLSALPIPPLVCTHIVLNILGPNMILSTPCNFFMSNIGRIVLSLSTMEPMIKVFIW